MPRIVALAPLSCAAFLSALPLAQAQNPIPATVTVDELTHSVEVELDRDGATLRVTRTLFNPTLFHARVDLPIPLPCEALLDEFAVAQAQGWKPAELLSPDDASARFDAYFDSTFDLEIEHVHDSDSAMLLTRDWGCDAELSIYPVPPVSQRSFAYRLFIPSVYADGRYTIELPSFDAYGQIPTLELAGLADASLDASVDKQNLDASGAELAGDRSHTIVLTPRDEARGRVRSVDLDVAALVEATPAAKALLAADAGPLPRLIGAELEAPSKLAEVPRVRRAVVLLDASRSLQDSERARLQEFAAAYFEALVEQDAEVEVLLFDRQVRRVYHDFVPASWGADDLPKLEIGPQNGSEVGRALAAARELLAEPTSRDGADWIIVLSDLTLRSDFDVAAEHAAADASAIRVHVVREVGHGTFGPAPADDPWTALARAAGGMAWEDSGGSSFADELVSPKRIWNLGLELELADGSHRSEALDPYFAAGGVREWSDADHLGAALTRAAFVGEVWGQRRAWTGTPSELEGRRTAGALATDVRGDLGDAVLTAFAFHAQVVSRFSSAWALAQFDGTAPQLVVDRSIGFGLGGAYGCSTRCGGSRCGGHGNSWNPVDFATLAQQAIAVCRPNDGSYSFETTHQEIVAVASPDRCITEETWLTDITATESYGRKRITINHAAGQVTEVEIVEI